MTNTNNCTEISLNLLKLDHGQTDRQVDKRTERQTLICLQVCWKVLKMKEKNSYTIFIIIFYNLFNKIKNSASRLSILNILKLE